MDGVMGTEKTDDSESRTPVELMDENCSLFRSHHARRPIVPPAFDTRKPRRRIFRSANYARARNPGIRNLCQRKHLCIVTVSLQPRANGDTSCHRRAGQRIVPGDILNYRFLDSLACSYGNPGASHAIGEYEVFMRDYRPRLFSSPNAVQPMRFCRP